jgi:hypothetical protein
LSTFNLSYCENISDAGLAALARGCPHLKTINLSYCENISDKGVTALADGSVFFRGVLVFYVGCVDNKINRRIYWYVLFGHLWFRMPHATFLFVISWFA